MNIQDSLDLLGRLGAHSYITDAKFNEFYAATIKSDLDTMKKFIAMSSEYLRYSYEKHYNTLFTSAVVVNNPEGAKLLLDAGASVNGDKDNSPLVWAAEYKQYSMMEFLISAKADVNARNYNHKYALPLVVQQNNKHIVQKLIEAKADPDIYFGAALTTAASNNRAGIVRILLKARADVNEDNSEALIKAIKHRHIKIVHTLINKRADVNANINRGEYNTPLEEACETGNPDIVQLLLYSKASVVQSNAKDIQTNSQVLYYAANRDNPEILELILDAGVDAKKCPVQTLIRIINSCNVNNIATILEAKANPNANPGILSTAAIRGNVEVIKVLLQYGADFNLYQEHGLQAAIEFASTEIVHMLINDKTNMANPKLLEVAVDNRKFYTVKTLVSRGALFSSFTLDDAVRRNELLIVESLLESKHPIDFTNRPYVISAVKTPSYNMLHLLVTARADVHAENDAAIYIASDRNNKPIVNLLLEYGADETKQTPQQYAEYVQTKKIAFCLGLLSKNKQSTIYSAFTQHNLSERFVIRLVFEFLKI